MPDWRIYSTTDMAHRKDYATRLSVNCFAWATGDAYAVQCVYRNGKCYWFIASFYKKDENSQGGLAIGVAVSDRFPRTADCLSVTVSFTKLKLRARLR